MKDIILRKYFTQEQRDLRSQIADCLLYLKKGREHGYYVPREDVEVLEDTIDTTHAGVSLDVIADGIDPVNYDKVFLRGVYTRDYDGYDGAQIDVYTIRKQTDKEYFDSLCSYILPTQYQNGQYETYLRLKKQFEGEL